MALAFASSAFCGTVGLFSFFLVYLLVLLKD